MQITVKGKNVEITDALKDYAEEKIGKLTKYLDSITSADVTLSTERNWHIVEVTVHANGVSLRGEERTTDMYSSIDQVIDKLERQVKRRKDKFSRKPKYESIRTGTDIFSKKMAYPETLRGREEILEEVSLEPKIVKVRMFANKPMTVHEAIKEMEAMGHSFFVFLNAKSDQISVIYKRKNGFGLIEPSLE